jgi:glycerol-3-phosphate dehydrogenase
MKRNIEKLENKEYDLIVIGGGIFGACAAWDAVLRGLSVALIEKDDFCQATSAHHFKMIHGGMRYLQHLDVKRVRESCRERSILLKTAPHLATPLPILMPTHGPDCCYMSC